MGAAIDSLPGVDSAFVECINQLGSKSYNEGIYSVFDPNNVIRSTKMIWDAFPEYNGKVAVFGCDWLGRYFAVDTRRLETGRPQILSMEPGAGEVLQIPNGIEAFHNVDLIEYEDAALAFNFFQEWKSLSGEEIGLGQCVGYKTPLFLGGSDTVDNLELIDREVYTDICGQLRGQTLTLKEGQVISGIKLVD